MGIVYKIVYRYKFMVFKWIQKKKIKTRQLNKEISTRLCCDRINIPEMLYKIIAVSDEWGWGWGYMLTKMEEDKEKKIYKYDQTKKFVWNIS